MNPEHREVTRLCHPWLLDPGIPIANGVFGKGVAGAPGQAVCDWKGHPSAPGMTVCDWSTEATLPCRGDVIRLNLTALSEVQLFLFTGFIEMPKTLFQRGDSSPRTVNMLASVGIFSLISSKLSVDAFLV
jgi:hypothetical protein